MLTHQQVLEEQEIQERVRARWNPNWREKLDHHRKSLGRVKIKGSPKVWIRKRNPRHPALF